MIPRCIECFKEQCNADGQFDCPKHKPSCLGVLWDFVRLMILPGTLIVLALTAAERAVRWTVRQELQAIEKERAEKPAEEPK